jgi:aldehyde dehydrogenase (NAD+)
VFFGQGVNPFIVGPSADLGKAARDLVAVRLFNSGQDCMGPDAIFVSEQIIEAFLHQLRARLDMVEFGPRKEPTADYGPLYYHPAISGITNYFLDNESRIVYGGKVDYSKRHVEPAIIRSSIHDRADIIEFFGPVFNLITYDTVEALTHELSKDFYTERALGASIYGVPKLEAFLRKRHMVSVDCTLFDLEDGNTPFGGYGRMANYAWCKGDLRIEPILLSRMVADMKGRQR